MILHKERLRKRAHLNIPEDSWSKKEQRITKLNCSSISLPAEFTAQKLFTFQFKKIISYTVTESRIYLHNAVQQCIGLKKQQNHKVRYKSSDPHTVQLKLVMKTKTIEITILKKKEKKNSTFVWVSLQEFRNFLQS